MRDIFLYYAYAYGLRLFLIPAGMVLLWKRERQAFWALLSIMPAFVLVNTVQLSAASIYENHKWLKAANLGFDIAAAFAVCSMSRLGKWRGAIAVTATLLVSTLSGLIELVPYVLAAPTQLYARIDTPLVTAVRTRTPPRSVFLSDRQIDIHLAGRKVFLGAYHSANGMGLNTARRQNIKDKIVAASSARDFCALASANGIDYVELTKQFDPRLLEDFKSRGFSLFNVEGDNRVLMSFVPAAQCASLSSGG